MGKENSFWASGSACLKQALEDSEQSTARLRCSLKEVVSDGTPFVGTALIWPHLGDANTRWQVMYVGAKERGMQPWCHKKQQLDDSLERTKRNFETNSSQLGSGIYPVVFELKPPTPGNGLWVLWPG
jgi:hypothetical protein